MYDNYNYPPGADTPDAPWNEPVRPEIDAEVYVQFTVERIATITTDEVWWDEDQWELLDDADLDKAYDAEYIQIPEMLNELIKYVKAEADTLRKFIKSRTANKEEKERYRYLQRILESAGGWEVTDRDSWKL